MIPLKRLQRQLLPWLDPLLPQLIYLHREYLLGRLRAVDAVRFHRDQNSTALAKEQVSVYSDDTCLVGLGGVCKRTYIEGTEGGGEKKVDLLVRRRRRCSLPCRLTYGTCGCNVSGDVQPIHVLPARRKHT